MKSLAEMVSSLKRGNEALKTVGFPHEFAAQITVVLQHFATGLSFRAGDPGAYSAKRAPKSGLQLSKSSNHGFLNSYIPVDPSLTRLDARGRPIGHHKKDLERLANGSQHTTQLNLSLRELFSQKDMELTYYDRSKQRLVFQYKEGKGPADFTGSFVIDLNNRIPIDKRHYASPWDAPTKISTETILKALDEQGLSSLASELENEYPISYSKEPYHSDIRLHTLQVFSQEDLPITRDLDLFMTGHPTRSPKYVTEVCNSFLFPEKTKLIAQTEDWFKELRKQAVEKREFIKATVEKGGKPREQLTAFEHFILEARFEDLYNEFSLDRAGCITPFEFFLNRTLNYAYADERNLTFGEKGKVNYNPNIKELIQHGSENRNPYQPSDLDGKMLHFYQGLIFLTENQDQLVHLYLHTDYLENNLIDIHPGWPMDKWSPVVQRQIDLGQTVPPQTLASYQHSLLLNDLARRESIRLTPEILTAIEHQKKYYQTIPARIEAVYQKHLKEERTITRP